MASTPNFISSVQTARRLALSRSSIYRLIDDDPTFPRPVKVGLKKIAFVETEVDAYIQARMSARNQNPGCDA